MGFSMRTLYSALREAGVPVSGWHSDLYFPCTAQANAVVKQCLADGTLVTRPTVFCLLDGSLTYEALSQFPPFRAKPD